MLSEISTACVKNGELPIKRPRYLVINEEVFVEHGNHLISVADLECRQKAQNGSENLDDQKSPGTKIKYTIEEHPRQKLYLSQLKDIPKTNPNNGANFASNSTEDGDDDSSDEMVIISDEEALCEKKSEREDDKPKRSPASIGQNISSLVKSFKVGETSEDNVQNTEDNDSESTYKQETKGSSILHKGLPIGAMDHFPVVFNKKMTVPVSDVGNPDLVPTQRSKSDLIECPYCSFKVKSTKFTRHLISGHIEACFCVKCCVIKTCTRLHCTGIRKQDKTLVHVLRCVKCIFETDNMVSFRRHLSNVHSDAILRQCGICGEWMEKNKKVELMIQSLTEHVKLKHLLQPDEKHGE